MSEVLGEPGLVHAAHSQRHGQAQVTHQGPLVDGDILQHCIMFVSFIREYVNKYFHTISIDILINE